MRLLKRPQRRLEGRLAEGRRAAGELAAAERSREKLKRENSRQSTLLYSGLQCYVLYCRLAGRLVGLEGECAHLRAALVQCQLASQRGLQLAGTGQERESSEERSSPATSGVFSETGSSQHNSPPAPPRPAPPKPARLDPRHSRQPRSRIPLAGRARSSSQLSLPGSRAPAHVMV